MIRLDVLSEEVGIWSRRNFGMQTLVSQALKACEEVGELAGATLKERQVIRVSEGHQQKARAAVGDIVIVLANYCYMRDWSLDQIVAEVWGRVRERDWKKNPDDAHLDGKCQYSEGHMDDEQ